MAKICFDSASALARYFIDNCDDSDEERRREWCGGMTGSEASQMILNGGDLSLVSEAETLCEKISAGIETTDRNLSPAPFGGFACVPEAIIGEPTAMRRMLANSDDCKPISIYVTNTCSGGIEADLMLKRGVAILALAMELQKIRPIQLYMVTTLSHRTDWISAVITKLDTSPLNLAECCHMLTAMGVERGMNYRVSDTNGGGGGWPSGFVYGQQRGNKADEYNAKIREEFGMTDEDLYIPATYLGDPLLDDPVSYINEIINGYLEA